MTRATFHKATATLKVPFHTDPDTELAALRIAGIPVDDRGLATTGFLHMRTTAGYRSRIFRWFADADAKGLRASPATLGDGR
ncbi:hypothetical protein [Variovorax sp. IB41]|jgi:hypothetical protein|uniref:hypothetical protein n=1 Tax=Variovorax sp. IB41 TaxID=2779370 RepID=UPI0018E78228|nr:hypothetical protein [Variovorax sp. IB41]MBJ2155136.1 hypothetical protein [Variovorax sp. IB41]